MLLDDYKGSFENFLILLKENNTFKLQSKLNLFCETLYLKPASTSTELSILYSNRFIGFPFNRPISLSDL